MRADYSQLFWRPQSICFCSVFMCVNQLGQCRTLNIFTTCITELKIIYLALYNLHLSLYNMWLPIKRKVFFLYIIASFTRPHWSLLKYVVLYTFFLCMNILHTHTRRASRRAVPSQIIIHTVQSDLRICLYVSRFQWIYHLSYHPNPAYIYNTL